MGPVIWDGPACWSLGTCVTWSLATEEIMWKNMGTDIDPARIGQCVPVVMTFRTVPIQPVVCSVLDNIQHRRHFQIWLPFITEIKKCEAFQKIVASSSIGDIYILYSELNDCSLIDRRRRRHNIPSASE